MYTDKHKDYITDFVLCLLVYVSLFWILPLFWNPTFLKSATLLSSIYLAVEGNLLFYYILQKSWLRHPSFCHWKKGVRNWSIGTFDFGTYIFDDFVVVGLFLHFLEFLMESLVYDGDEHVEQDHVHQPGGGNEGGFSYRIIYVILCEKLLIRYYEVMLRVS